MFTGQEKDSGSGLYYYGARYYDPELGRFIQPDTYLDTLNRYAYCYNNPVNYTDPTGHFPWDAVLYGAVYTVAAYLKGVESSGSWNPFDWSEDDWWYAASLGTGILNLGFSTVTGIFADAGPVHYSPGEDDQANDQADALNDSLNQLNDALYDANYFYDLYYQDPYGIGGGSDLGDTPGDDNEIQRDGAPGGFPVWPVPGYNNAVTSNYGDREDPFTKKDRFHPGIDIGAPEGTPVVAVYGGKYVCCILK